LRAGRSWACCNIGDYPRLSGIPARIVRPALRHAKDAHLVEVDIAKRPAKSTLLFLCATEAGIVKVDATLSMMQVISARW
jgi:hypothetical protein